MFDALLYCSIVVANMRHAGYFTVATSLFAAARAKWLAVRAAVLRGRRPAPQA